MHVVVPWILLQTIFSFFQGFKTCTETWDGDKFMEQRQGAFISNMKKN